MSTLHVVPVNDLVAHDANPDCVCGPTPQVVPNDEDGPDGWLYVHHSLDGRERDDPPPDIDRPHHT